MKLIPLGKGLFAKVDDADYDRLARHKWTAVWSKNTRSWKAVRYVMMAREVLDLADPKIIADHENHDTLDNQRGNLRGVTHSQNMMNKRGAYRNSKTGVRGVSAHHKLFRARIDVNGKQINLGDFPTIELAAAAYATANRQYFGEFGGSC